METQKKHQEALRAKLLKIIFDDSADEAAIEAARKWNIANFAGVTCTREMCVTEDAVKVLRGMAFHGMRWDGKRWYNEEQEKFLGELRERFPYTRQQHYYDGVPIHDSVDEYDYEEQPEYCICGELAPECRCAWLDDNGHMLNAKGGE